MSRVRFSWKTFEVSVKLNITIMYKKILKIIIGILFLCQPLLSGSETFAHSTAVAIQDVGKVSAVPVATSDILYDSPRTVGQAVGYERHSLQSFPSKLRKGDGFIGVVPLPSFNLAKIYQNSVFSSLGSARFIDGPPRYIRFRSLLL